MKLLIFLKHIQQCISLSETKESVKISGNLSQTLVSFSLCLGLRDYLFKEDGFS